MCVRLEKHNNEPFRRNEVTGVFPFPCGSNNEPFRRNEVTGVFPFPCGSVPSFLTRIRFSIHPHFLAIYAGRFASNFANSRSRSFGLSIFKKYSPGAACREFFFSFTHIYFPASGQAVVTGVVPSPPGSCIQFLSPIGLSNSTASRIFMDCC